MSWNDQDIDQLFKGAKAPEPAAFQESFWSEMEAMLPEQKRKKAGLWWIVSGAATLVLLAGGMFWVANQPEEGARLASQMKPFFSDNHLDVVSKRVTESFRPGVPCGTIDLMKDPSYFNSFNERNSTLLVKTPKSIVSNQSPLTSNPNANLINDTDIKSEQTKDELVIVDQLPPYVFDFNRVNGCPEKYISVTTDCKNLHSCMLEATTFPKAPRFYVQASAGIGQSAQHVVGQSDLVHFYTVGGGLYKKLDRMVFTFGANVRVDFAKNILYTSYPSSNTRVDTKYSQLYSFEMPVSMGYESGRNSIVATVTPGFQTAFSGNQQETQNEVLVRSEQTFGKISNAKTLTMEIGANYWRSLTPNWYVGLGLNVDILKPFNSTMYAGEQRLLPLNGQLSLRRTF